MKTVNTRENAPTPPFQEHIFQNYTLENYIRDVESLGLEKTWDAICQYVTERRVAASDFLDIRNFGELYEIGLAIQDKILKKKSGQYYTPDDVAQVMSEWLGQCEGEAVCDVACGTGKLILTYLDFLGYEQARELIAAGKLYLYDFDKVALKICSTIIAIQYGLDIADSIQAVSCDFLDKTVVLPKDCKVISNPPYAHISAVRDGWEDTDVLRETKEFYSAFMEKICLQAKAAVVITPFSFISGAKFSALRKLMCSRGKGFIVSFDNVPGNIFCGRKHGVFNTNTANSVRAAITVYRRSEVERGFRVSPLIRFKNEERQNLLQRDVLEKMLPDDLQIAEGETDVFQKVHKSLKPIFDDWVEKSGYSVKDVAFDAERTYLIDMPNTCRYFTTASSRKLSRSGSITIYLEDETLFHFLYCFINSSFVYWWWRIFDGAITYPLNLFYSIPLPVNLLTDGDREFFAKMCHKMQAEEKNYIVTKVNAGVVQENIKFPECYRVEINERILKMLGHDVSGTVFDKIHANQFTGE